MPGNRLIVAPVLAGIALGSVVGSPAQAAPKCFGKTATIVGTPGKDKLEGGAGPDVMVGLGGMDILLGRGGKDRLCGRGDDDVLIGGKASDRMAGGGGSDFLLGGGGHDEETGGGGFFDVLRGRAGNDRLSGGGGDDRMMGEKGNDRLDGGAGFFDVGSFLFAQAGVTVDLTLGTATGEGNDTLAAIEDLEGSSHDDVLTGNAGDNFIRPLSGDDVVNGGEGIRDGAGFFFSPAAVTVDLTLGTSTGEGSDSLAGIEDVEGSAFDDNLTGSAISNSLLGFSGNDTISGLDGDDLLVGDVGTDTADGGAGTMDRCIDFENGSPPPGCEFTTPRGRRPLFIHPTG